MYNVFLWKDPRYRFCIGVDPNGSGYKIRGYRYPVALLKASAEKIAREKQAEGWSTEILPHKFDTLGRL